MAVQNMMNTSSQPYQQYGSGLSDWMRKRIGNYADENRASAFGTYEPGNYQDPTQQNNAMQNMGPGSFKEPWANNPASGVQPTGSAQGYLAPPPSGRSQMGWGQSQQAAQGPVNTGAQQEQQNVATPTPQATATPVPQQTQRQATRQRFLGNQAAKAATANFARPTAAGAAPTARQQARVNYVKRQATRKAK